jgi:hypothetical protein
LVENSFEVQTKRGNNDIDVAEWWSECTKIVRKTGSKCILKGRISFCYFSVNYVPEPTNHTHRTTKLAVRLDHSIMGLWKTKLLIVKL